MIKSSESYGSGGNSHIQSVKSEPLVDLLSVLLRRKELIIASAGLGLLIGALYYLLSPRTYESRAQVLVMQNDAILSGNKSSANRDSVSEDLLATHMSMLQGKLIVENALKDSGLYELPSIQEKLGDDDTPTDYVIKNLFITRGGEGAARDARVLKVAFRHSDPDDSKKVVEALLHSYMEFVTSKFRDVNEEAVDLINRARLELESDIEQLTTEYRAFRNNSPLLSATEGGANVYAIQYEELSAELSNLDVSIDESRGRLHLVKEQLERLDKLDAHQIEKLALIDERNAERLGILVTVERGESQTAAFQAPQPERMAGATTEYTSLLMLKGQLAQAMQDHGPKHPMVKTLETQVEEMEEFFRERRGVLEVDDDAAQLTPDDVMGAYVRLLENDLVALEKRREDLVRQIQKVEVQAKELVDYELEDQQRLRELARGEELYDSIVARLRDINMQKDSSALIQEIIEEPLAGEKVSPKGIMAAAISILATMLLSGAAVLASELSDQRIHSAKELEDIYHAKIISHFADFKQDPEARNTIRKIASTKPSVSPQVIALHERKSRISETVRGIRTQLLFDLHGEHSVLAITSPNKGDGKSTIAANVVVSIAQAGKSVLFIDCDMRRPAVHKLFGLSNDRGLSSILGQGMDFLQAVQPGPVENLTVLTAGPNPNDPADLLCTDHFRSLLEVLRGKFDYVILDCPPVLPVADPTIIAPLVDSVLLVTSCLDNRGLPKARQCQRNARILRANLLGLIVNRTSKQTNNYNYNGYGGDYSEYAEYEAVPAGS